MINLRSAVFFFFGGGRFQVQSEIRRNCKLNTPIFSVVSFINLTVNPFFSPPEHLNPPPPCQVDFFSTSNSRCSFITSPIYAIFAIMFWYLNPVSFFFFFRRTRSNYWGFALDAISFLYGSFLRSAFLLDFPCDSDMAQHLEVGVRSI